MKKLVIILIAILLAGCAGTSTIREPIGQNLKGNTVYQKAIIMEDRGFFSPSMKTLVFYKCTIYNIGGDYEVCKQVGVPVVASQSGMGSAVVTTAIQGAGLYWAAGALRPDEYNSTESNNIAVEGSKQAQLQAQAQAQAQKQTQKQKQLQRQKQSIEGQKKRRRRLSH